MIRKHDLTFLLVALVLLAGRPSRASTISLTTLYSFIGGADGLQPHGALIEGSDGNLYGTTSGGGLSGAGTVFTINSLGTLTTLYSFSGSADGGQPRGALVQGSDGNYYGTTVAGGLLNGAGTVFSLTSTGMLTTLYRFSGLSDGGQPYGGLVEGSDSNFYGTTYGGGVSGAGTLFRVNSQGTLTTLYSFSGGADGANPAAGLVPGPNNSFFGTTYGGGVSTAGTVFVINSLGTLTSLYSFTGGADGANPSAVLVEGPKSNFFGTTFGGGESGTGTVFKINMQGGLTSLYSFTGGADGAQPEAGLVFGSDGNLYGTTSAGGANGLGTAFKISTAGALTSLYSFSGTNGANPEAELVQGSVSNFYGTTAAGGLDNAGTVFTLVQPCTYSIAPTHVTLPAIDEQGTFTITAGITNCPWTAASSADWITITSAASGLGDGTISYSVTANPSPATRSGTIAVAGKTFTVTQQSQVLGQFLQGTYNGLVQQSGTPAEASSGFFSLVLGKTGSFKAVLTVGGVRSTFSGAFDSSGNATNTVSRKNLSSLHVILHLLSVTNETDQITGTVSDGVNTSELLADLAVFSSVNPCPFTGRYTFLLEPADSSDTAVPQGYGYGTLTVTTSGSGAMQGALGDGTKISATIPVSGYGTWPLYASLYKNQGSCLGLLTFGSNSTLTATVDWFKPPVPSDHDYPAGFTTTVSVTGAIYVSPKAGGPSIAGSGQLTLGGGNLQSNLVKNVVINAQGNVTVTPLDVDKLTLKIQPTTGQFSGGFVDPAVGKTTKLNGLLLQPDNTGAGYFPGSSQTGFILFGPAR
jgi:uncharacterized repeat protein (TIGR03803 family)